MSVNFDAYKVFYLAAELKSITAAARELYVTQPTVTHSIRKLETELGCELFVRGKKGVGLTPEGAVLYKYVKAGCEQFWQGEKEIEKRKKFEAGEILLGASEATLHHFLLPYLKQYKKQYPDIYLKISNANTFDIMEDIRQERISCGILIFPDGYQDEMLEIQPLAECNDVVVAGDAYRKLAEQTVSVSGLSEYPLVGLSSNTLTSILLTGFFQKYHAEYRPDIELATSDLIVPAVMNNLGIGIVPEVFAAEALRRNEVFRISLLEKIPDRNICLVYKKNSQLPIAVEAFLKMIIA